MSKTIAADVRLYEAGPTVAQLRTPIGEGSSWSIDEELVPYYLQAVEALTFDDARAAADLVTSAVEGMRPGGKGMIAPTVLVNLRAIARSIYGLAPIDPALVDTDLSRGWGSDIEPSVSGLRAYVLHDQLVDRATRLVPSSIVSEVSCQACGTPGAVRAGLCDSCSSVLEVVQFRRAEALGRERVGRASRLEAVERWLDR